jgi:hypothetical protein
MLENISRTALAAAFWSCAGSTRAPGVVGAVEFAGAGFTSSILYIPS